MDKYNCPIAVASRNPPFMPDIHKVAPLKESLKDCAAAAAKLESAASEDRQSIQNQVQACARV